MGYLEKIAVTKMAAGMVPVNNFNQSLINLKK